MDVEPIVGRAGRGIGPWVITALGLVSLAWVKEFTAAPARAARHSREHRASYRIGRAIDDAVRQRNMADPSAP